MTEISSPLSFLPLIKRALYIVGIFPAGNATSKTGPIIWVTRPTLVVSTELLITRIKQTVFLAKK